MSFIFDKNANRRLRHVLCFSNLWSFHLSASLLQTLHNHYSRRLNELKGYCLIVFSWICSESWKLCNLDENFCYWLNPNRSNPAGWALRLDQDLSIIIYVSRENLRYWGVTKMLFHVFGPQRWSEQSRARACIKLELEKVCDPEKIGVRYGADKKK